MLKLVEPYQLVQLFDFTSALISAPLGTVEKPFGTVGKTCILESLPGREPQEKETLQSVVQFDQFPEASWAGFWAPGASWAGFLAPKSLPGGEQGTPRQKLQTLQSVQLFNLISFLGLREPQEKTKAFSSVTCSI